VSTEELGPWEPLTVDKTVELFRSANFRWWIAGGLALQTHFESAWRSHDDTDIGILRGDAPRLYSFLKGWDIHIAANGILTPWLGQRLDDRSDLAGNNLWCRRRPDGPWELDILIGDGDADDWIYRRNTKLRRPWFDAVLTSNDDIPYLAPDLQLLFKSKEPRPKDDVDAATVIPKLQARRRTWLAHQLPPTHPWQTIIAGARAEQVARPVSSSTAKMNHLASGRSSQAWYTADENQERVIRVPIPNSGRLPSYRSEALIGELLADRGHPVSQWQTQTVDDVECTIGTMLEGNPSDYDTEWTSSFVDRLAAILRDLHALPTHGWGPLENRNDRLQGSSTTENEGIIDRWFHGQMWPFEGSDLLTHPLARLEPDIATVIARQRDAILAASRGPYGLVHSDLHKEHLLQIDAELTGVLDFGAAFIGSTAWDFALIHWYYGAQNTLRVARSYGSGSYLTERAALLAVAVGCYKVAKSPHDPTPMARLQKLQSD